MRSFKKIKKQEDERRCKICVVVNVMQKWWLGKLSQNNLKDLTVSDVEDSEIPVLRDDKLEIAHKWKTSFLLPTKMV